MEKSMSRVSTDTLDSAGSGERERLGEERARQILERAAALDATLSSEIDIAQLREAAAAAGISTRAFDQAVREHSEAGAGGQFGGPSWGSSVAASSMTAPGPAEVARYAGLLRDLLGEDARVTVVEDRIEARDDEGVTVTVNPSSGDATAAILSEGRLRGRLLAICLPAVLPLFLGVLIGMDDEDVGIAAILAVLLTVLGAIAATVVTDVREKQARRKKTERLRRQLQRMLLSGSDDG